MIGETVSHYRILEKLGEGGMGVVYRARDTKLEREVALKFLPADLVSSEDAKKRFFQEAQTASALDHPNICTIFEIDEAEDGRLFLAMAYYEGDSVGDLVSTGPIEPEGALSIAQQIVQGLIKAHEKGIVHRDIKPGNILITPDGLVKIVDFGLAMLTGQTRITQAGDVLGTAAYMAPEQIQGHDVDQRTDLWSLGVMLYEMVTGRLPFVGDYQQAVIYSIINNDPPPMAESEAEVPQELQRAIMKCLAKSPEERYQSSQDLLNDLQAISSVLMPSAGKGADALIDMTARTAGRPYPGLASFSESDSGFFFGRESEVESLWHRLPGQDLLAVIGPSGTGKTSFLRAGVIPARPDGWSIITCTPGSAPFLALRQALVPELAGDTDAIRDLLRDDEIDATLSAFARWRKMHDEALLILDQFEELFTLNAPEVQSQFTDLMGRLSREANVRILLSLRDDFLFSCHGHPALKPVFESLIPLGPLTGEDLRRALTEPAAQVGYRFEDDSLVDEMIDQVEGERGALPLLAFAMSRMWDKRDRGAHLLTRKAYEEIGGVSGALAQHAESTMDRIGAGKQQIVRELFRNLVTSKTTRIARRRHELLSLFEDMEKDAADQVLRELTRARLLNSYEDPQEEGEGVRRIEIVHESLINGWPRLVRWQTQDEDSAQLRDEVRQAAETWEAKGRPRDLLWTGSLYQEIVLWRDKYPGALTSKEEAFYAAIQARAKQKKRRLVTAVAGGFAIMAIVLVAIIGLLQKSRTAEAARDKEARVAEANLLLSLSKGVADECPTTGVAYALASLEHDDREDTRKHVLRTLIEGPCFSAFERNGPRNPWAIDASPDGKYFAVGWSRDGVLWLHHTDSDSTMQLLGQAGFITQILFDRDSKRLLASSYDGRSVVIWSIPDGTVLNTIKVDGWPWAYWTDDPDRIVTATTRGGKPYLWHSWSLNDGSSRILREEGMPFVGDKRGPPVASPDGRRFADFIGRDIFLFSLVDIDAEPVYVGSHENNVSSLCYNFDGDRLASFDFNGNLQVRDMTAPSYPVLNEFSCPPGGDLYWSLFDHQGDYVASCFNDGILRVWDLNARPGTRPLKLTGDTHWAELADFFSDGRWMVSTHNGGRVVAWSLEGKYPVDFSIEVGITGSIRHLPDGSALIALTRTQSGLEFWHIPMDSPGMDPRKISGFQRNLTPSGINWTISPDGKDIAVSTVQHGDPPVIIPVDGDDIRALDIPEGTLAHNLTYSRNGDIIAAILNDEVSMELTNGQLVRIWDTATGESRDLDVKAATMIFRSDEELITYRFTTASGDRLESHSDTTWTWIVESWNINDGTMRTIRDKDFKVTVLAFSPSGRLCTFRREDGHFVIDHDTGETRKIYDRLLSGTSIAFNDDESMLAYGLWEGDIYLIPLDGGEPYFLPGNEIDYYLGMSFDPGGRYLATSKEQGDGNIRLWPLPEGSSKLFLPGEEFLEFVRSQTNIRAVPDPESETGFRIDLAPFAGFDKPPIR